MKPGAMLWSQRVPVINGRDVPDNKWGSAVTIAVFITAEGTRQSVEVTPGLTLMEAAVQEGVPGIDGECGGSCNCGTCHVWVDEEWLVQLPAPGALEAGMLEGIANARPNSRLCCQLQAGDVPHGMVLRVAERA